MEPLVLLEPEVAGGWGPATIVQWEAPAEAGAQSLPQVTYLDYRFDGWLGDDLVGFLSSYIVTPCLRDVLLAASFTGFRLAKMSTERSDMWMQIHPERELPKCQHLVLAGEITYREDGSVASWSGHDLCFGRCIPWSGPEDIAKTALTIPPYGMVVTDTVFASMKQCQLDNCESRSLIFFGPVSVCRSSHGYE